MSIGIKFASGAVVASMLFLGAGAALAQTNTLNGTAGTATGTGTGTTMSSTTGKSSATGTPGIPNTGAGGDVATNMALLAAAGVMAVGSGLYLARRRWAL